MCMGAYMCVGECKCVPILYAHILAYAHAGECVCTGGMRVPPCEHEYRSGCVHGGACVYLWCAHTSMCILAPVSSSCSFDSPASIGVPVVGTGTWHVCCHRHYSVGTMTDSPTGS